MPSGLRTDICALAEARGPPAQWEELVAEAEHVLEWGAAAAGDALLLCYLQASPPAPLHVFQPALCYA